MRIHMGKTQHYCKICPKQFGDIGSLRRHLSMHNRRSQTNSYPPIEETLEIPAKSEASNACPNIEANIAQSTINQMPSTAAPGVRWTIDQNGAPLQMSSDEPTSENISTYDSVSGPLNLIAPPNGIENVFFKAD